MPPAVFCNGKGLTKGIDKRLRNEHIGTYKRMRVWHELDRGAWKVNSVVFDVAKYFSCNLGGNFFYLKIEKWKNILNLHKIYSLHFKIPKINLYQSKIIQCTIKVWCLWNSQHRYQSCLCLRWKLKFSEKLIANKISLYEVVARAEEKNSNL